MASVEELISMGASGSVPALLTVIAYFLRLLLQEIRDLKMEQTELREFCIWLKAEQDSLKQSLSIQAAPQPRPARRKAVKTKAED